METAALLVGYVVGRGNQDVVSSESPELHRISSILESLRKQLCGDQNMEAAIEKAHELGVTLSAEQWAYQYGHLDRVSRSLQAISQNIGLLVRHSGANNPQDVLPLVENLHVRRVVQRSGAELPDERQELLGEGTTEKWARILEGGKILQTKPASASCVICGAPDTVAVMTKDRVAVFYSVCQECLIKAGLIF